jgi:hypothetical protein
LEKEMTYIKKYLCGHEEKAPMIMTKKRTKKTYIENIGKMCPKCRRKNK